MWIELDGTWINCDHIIVVDIEKKGIKIMCRGGVEVNYPGEGKEITPAIKKELKRMKKELAILNLYV